MGIDNVYGTGGLRPGVTTSSARPAAPYNGQVIYETDTDKIAVYDGSSWVYKTADVYPKAGAVLQVVSTTKTDTYTHSSGKTFTSVTGLTAAITPSSTSNKVLVIVQVSFGGNNGSTWLKITGGNTTSYVGTTAGSRISVASASLPAVNTQINNAVLVYLDSPATTSGTTYGVQIAAGDGTTTTYINRTPTDTDNDTYTRGASTITVMEIAG